MDGETSERERLPTKKKNHLLLLCCAVGELVLLITLTVDIG